MYCPSCGKQIPDKSIFCLHCGESIKTVFTSQSSTEWQYKDFTYGFSSGSIWAKVGSGAYTEAGAKLEFWQQSQQDINLKLQQWLDEGWEPVGEIGPASLKIRTYRGAKYSAIGWILLVIISLPLLLLPLLFVGSTYAEPIEFRIKMRRPKSDYPSGSEVALSPPLIIIERVSQPVAILSKFGVYIDGQKVGAISRGSTEAYQLEAGTHAIYVTCGYLSSNKLNFTLDLGEEVKLQCNLSRGMTDRLNLFEV